MGDYFEDRERANVRESRMSKRPGVSSKRTMRLTVQLHARSPQNHNCGHSRVPLAGCGIIVVPGKEDHQHRVTTRERSNVMGDKSPKNTQKQSKQKQAKKEKK
jgi:hypothetical protein